MLPLLPILPIAEAPLPHALPRPVLQQEEVTATTKLLNPPQELALPNEILNPSAPWNQPTSRQVVEKHDVRPLPGQLDQIPVFNSNSPELVQDQGILLSTFSPEGKKFPAAHLNFAFKGRFDIFAHHVVRASTSAQTHTLIQGLLVQNAGTETATLEVLQAASYLTRPDALYVDLPSYVEDPLGNVFAGPGSRTMNDILRGRNRGVWPSAMQLAPGESQLLMNLPIPVGRVVPSSNGRSTLIRLKTSAPVYAASLAMYSPFSEQGRERLPTLEEWQNLLKTSNLVAPRDLVPTDPDYVEQIDQMIYGRVAGVTQGSKWKALISDPGKDTLGIPDPEHPISYAISTLAQGRLGTKQIQSAPILARYRDTAHWGNGNYAVQYDLTLPLYNPTPETRTVTLALETPLKEDQPKPDTLAFLDPPDPRIFFRGTLRFRYTDDEGTDQTRYFHVVQRRGERGKPLVAVNLQPNDRRQVRVDFLYPPDATPPQVLTIRTLE